MNYGFIIFIELIDTQMVMSYRYPPKKNNGTTVHRTLSWRLPRWKSWARCGAFCGWAAAGGPADWIMGQDGPSSQKKMGGLNHELRDLMGFHGIYSGFWLVFWGFGWGFHHRNHESNWAKSQCHPWTESPGATALPPQPGRRRRSKAPQLSLLVYDNPVS